MCLQQKNSVVWTSECHQGLGRRLHSSNTTVNLRYFASLPHRIGALAPECYTVPKLGDRWAESSTVALEASLRLCER